MTTVRLNSDIENKLSTLAELEKSSKSEIIKEAIQEYYVNHTKGSSPYNIGKDLFGKHGSNSDLSATYKKKIQGILNEKYSN